MIIIACRRQVRSPTAPVGPVGQNPGKQLKIDWASHSCYTTRLYQVCIYALYICIQVWMLWTSCAAALVLGSWHSLAPPLRHPQPNHCALGGALEITLTLEHLWLLQMGGSSSPLPPSTAAGLGHLPEIPRTKWPGTSRTTSGLVAPAQQLPQPVECSRMALNPKCRLVLILSAMAVMQKGWAQEQRRLGGATQESWRISPYEWRGE